MALVAAGMSAGVPAGVYAAGSRAGWCGGKRGKRGRSEKGCTGRSALSPAPRASVRVDRGGKQRAGGIDVGRKRPSL